MDFSLAKSGSQAEAEQWSGVDFSQLMVGARCFPAGKQRCCYWKDVVWQLCRQIGHAHRREDGFMEGWVLAMAL